MVLFVAEREALKKNKAPRERVAVVSHRQVKKLSDFTFIIIPGACAHDERVNCDSCKFSTVKFAAARRSRRPQIQIGYVSCSYHVGCV